MSGLDFTMPQKASTHWTRLTSSICCACRRQPRTATCRRTSGRPRSPIAFNAEPSCSWIRRPAATVSTVAGWPAARGLTGDAARNGAIYFPRIRRPDPLRNGAVGDFAACGAVAGAIARTDADRGVWKAPANVALAGVTGLTVAVSDVQNGTLNAAGVNCLRTLPGAGPVVWGARTLRGTDAVVDQFKFVPVRRLALYLEESVYRGTQWVVFEPNDEPLWAQIRLSVGAFLRDLYRQGAFPAPTDRDAYFVSCGRDTMTQDDIDHGLVSITVAFAPLRPSEFVMIRIQHRAGDPTG